MTTTRASIWLASAALGAMAFASQPAFAQAAAQAPAANALEEVIVTADRRARNLQDVPSAITAVTGEQLQRARVVDLNSLASTVPSFSMTESSALGKELSIRGVTSVRILDATAEPSVGMFIDDVYISRLGSAFTDFYDLERIEVIRGPQGVLLGKNVVGGAISVITAKPQFDPAGQATVSFGNYNAVMTSGYVTGPLTDTLAARLAFQTRRRDGFSENVIRHEEMDDLDSYQGRGELLYVAAEGDLRALLTFDYGASKNNGTARVMSDDPFAAGTGAVTTYRRARNLGPRDATSPQHEYANRLARGASLRVDWGAFPGAKLTSISGWRSSKGDMSYNQLGVGSPPGLADTYYSTVERPETFSQELRLVSDASADSRLDWILGAFYQRDNVLRYDSNVATTSTTVAALSGTFLYRNHAHLKTAAVFGQVGFKITDQIKITAGLRYTKDKKNGERIARCLEDGGDGLCVAALVLAKNQSFTVDYGDSWNSLTPQGILEYRPNDDVMLYASVAKGFKGGGWDHLPSTAVAARIGYDPEKVTNYEVGAKADLLDRRLRVNAALFQMDYKDLQSQQLVLECLCLITSNAGTAKIKGIEAEATLAVVDGLTFSASGSLLDAKYDKFVDGAGVSFSGNTIQRSPKYKYDLSVAYEFGSGALEKAFSLRTTYTRQGKAYWTPNNTNFQKPFGLWDASLRFQPDGKAWSVTAWGKNLTDELYAVASQPFFGDLMNYYAPPRTYGVDVTYAF